MGAIGQLKTTKRIEEAIRDIRYWLMKINVDGITIDSRYDAKTNVAFIKFQYKNKYYEFRSTKQSNCRLNMWAISRVMESKVRNHLMEIEPFDKSMIAYLQLEMRADIQLDNDMHIDNKDSISYAILGISELASNDELKNHYRKTARGWHPDMAGSKEAKKIFEKKFSELNQAWDKIKRERGI